MEVEIHPKKLSKRKSNYIDIEKALLLALVAQNVHVIENKKTDASFSRMKEKAWRQLGDEFNQQNSVGITRTWEQLKSCYENIKYQTKKQITLNKVSVLFN